MRTIFATLLLLVSFTISAKTITLTKDNTISFSGPVTQATTTLAELELLQKCTPKKDLYLVLYTPGGSVIAGNYFINFVQALPCKVHTITLFAASMGYQIVQNLDNRYIIKSGTLMSHRASINGIGGQIPGELLTRIDWLRQLTASLNKIAAKRVGLDVKTYERLIYDELWVVGEAAVATNHADELVDVRCGKSLNSTYITQVQTFFGIANVRKHSCPLIIGPVEILSNDLRIIEEVETFFNPLKIKINGYEY